MIDITFGRQVCGSLEAAASREWLVTDGLGGFAMGTLAGLRTRRYHGLLVVAGDPPTGHDELIGRQGVSLPHAPMPGGPVIAKYKASAGAAHASPSAAAKSPGDARHTSFVGPINDQGARNKTIRAPESGNFTSRMQ